MNFDCWALGTWVSGSWVEGSWCPGVPPVPPTPEPIVREEPRRWPGPSIVIYKEPIDNYDTYYQRQRREENEIVIL